VIQSDHELSIPSGADRAAGDPMIRDKMTLDIDQICGLEVVPNENTMPTIYRAMKRADDGMPVVGSNSKELGVRVPPNPNGDIDLDENGIV